MLRPAHLLRYDRLATVVGEHPLILTTVVCLLWSLIGLVGHDPWKSEEAILTGMLAHAENAPIWSEIVVSEKFQIAGPLFYVVSGGFIRLFENILPLHDAARLSMFVWLTLTFIFVSCTAKELWGKTQQWVAPLLLAGCAGLLVKSHQLSTETLLLAGISILVYGLALAPRRSIAGGIFVGLAISILCLGSAVHNLAYVPSCSVLLVIANTRYRTSRFLTSLGIALIVAASFIALWVGVLYATDPGLPRMWSHNASETALDAFSMPSISRIIYPISILPWFTWPTWIFVIWSLWIEGREGIKRKELQLPLALWVTSSLIICMQPIDSEAQLIPILIPFALLGSIAASRTPRSGGNALYWFSIMSTVFFIVAAWVYFSASYFGFPERLAEHLFRLQPGYTPGHRPLLIAAALLLTLFWFFLLFNIKRHPERSITMWTLNLTVCWAISVLLLFHWIDGRKSYKTVFESMAASINTQYNCVIAQVGPAQRSLIHYHASIATTDVYEERDGKVCDYLIHQDQWDSQNTIGLPWLLIWEGGRSGDKSERYRLYRRELD